LIRTIDLRNAPPPDRAAAGGKTESPDSTLQSSDPYGISLITPVKDETQYRICLRYLNALQIPSGFTVEKVAVFGGASMAEVYQRAMETSTARYKIYLHVDAYVVHRGVLLELLNLFRTYPRLGMVGVEGATRLPAGVLYSVNNPFHIYGRIWNYRRPGGPSSILGPANRRRLHFSRFRSFVGDYLPAIVVDGFFMATQYDIPWTHPVFGFELYETVHALEFIKAGLEVGLARQESVWCIHWGPFQEPSRQERMRRKSDLHGKAATLRQLYPEFIGVPAPRLYERHVEAACPPGTVARKLGDPATDQQTVPRHFMSPVSVRERLGVVMMTFNGRETMRRALRALLLQCEALEGIDSSIVVVDSGTADYTIEAIRGEFPEVTVLDNSSDGGRARGFNLGLRQLGESSYILVMHSDAELIAGTLDRMVRYLRAHRHAGGAVASFANPDGTVQSQRMAIVTLVLRQPRKLQPISFIGNTCALVRGDVFFDVGLYDERFKLHHEDLEWSIRAKRKGYKFIFLPEATTIHHSGAGLPLGPHAASSERFVANLWLVYKHGGPRWAALLYYAQRLLARWLAFRWRQDSEALRQLGEAMACAESLYRKFREGDRPPSLLASERS